MVTSQERAQVFNDLITAVEMIKANCNTKDLGKYLAQHKFNLYHNDDLWHFETKYDAEIKAYASWRAGGKSYQVAMGQLSSNADPNDDFYFQCTTTSLAGMRRAVNAVLMMEAE